MSKVQQMWTDDEYGFLADHPDLDTEDIAESLGRSVRSVSDKRLSLRSGWQPSADYTLWSDEDDEIVRTTPDLTAERVAEIVGRSLNSVNVRRRKLGVKPSVNKNPFVVGGRPLVARTCPKCGLLLAAVWFRYREARRRTSSTKAPESARWTNLCRKCYSKPGRDHGENIHRHAQADRLQQVTARKADRHSQPYLVADHEVLADPDLTNIEKALALGRRYKAICSAVSSFGYHSRRGLGSSEAERWIIDNPNTVRLAS